MHMPEHKKIDLCIQQRHRSAWADAQSDVSLLSFIATHKVHSEDWSDWVEAQADLSLRRVHRSFCLFFHAPAPFNLLTIRQSSHRHRLVDELNLKSNENILSKFSLMIFFLIC